ncbi:MAG: hypothetical protein KDI33_05720 [Halioglobus sp.]|nr:hypothetical protein [Halioglobus sp.]
MFQAEQQQFTEELFAESLKPLVHCFPGVGYFPSVPAFGPAWQSYRIGGRILVYIHPDVHRMSLLILFGLLYRCHC